MVQLDESQRAFIKAPVGNIRLLAPAGCGKTLCLLHRCKYLSEKSQGGKSFLIFTFTRAAREELQTRITEDATFQSIRGQTEITTLNSWGLRQINRIWDFPKPIIDRQDFHFAMKNQLQPVWRNHEKVKRAVLHSNRWKRNQAPRILMGMIDALVVVTW